eukprot:CCRYP_015734-RA/>CCRYP_015734-RA protein AED:0.33 eAED:0.33 QI:0/0/0/1/1/1/3/0/754
MAIDIESHVRSCPVAERNEGRRVRRWRMRRDAAAAAAATATTTTTTSEGGGGGPAAKATAAIVLPRRANQVPPLLPRRRCRGPRNEKRKSHRIVEGRRRYDPNLDGDEEDEFCTLCEVEAVLGRVHSRPTASEVSLDGAWWHRERASSSSAAVASNPLLWNQDTIGRPVVPETFTAGFMSHVAPWFRRGVQEDSHEFLRLLIDAMQNSCKAARTKDASNHKNTGSNNSSNNTNSNKGRMHDDNERDDVEYPFRLFRGTVESNISVSTFYPSRSMPPHRPPPPPPPPPDESPPTADPTHEAQVPTILTITTPPPSPPSKKPSNDSRASNISIRDTNAKNAGKVGKATKTSKLASIPPILTLHLKRFRYGSLASSGHCSGMGGMGSHRRGAPRGGGGGGSGGGGGGNSALEVGPSGSAKIEGHVAFKSILDIKPYLTRELQEGTFKKAFCRLFAVVVHNGKNSHSGHYVAYVNSLSSKEWWKMDDAKVSRASMDEVLGCEAYMLFYRVVDHPVSKSLGEIAGRKAAEEKRIREEMERVIKEAEERARVVVEEEKAKAEATANGSAVAVSTAVDTSSSTSSATEAKPDADDDVSPGKRKRPELASGEEWAKAMTSLPASYFPLLKQIEDFISENVNFCPAFFTYITQEYHRMSSKLGAKKIKTLLGRGPSGVYPPQDVKEGAQDIRDGILDLFHMISIVYKSNAPKGKDGGSGMFLLPPPEVPPPTVDEESMPAMSLDQELIIPEPGDGFDGYDGAL